MSGSLPPTPPPRAHTPQPRAPISVSPLHCHSHRKALAGPNTDAISLCSSSLSSGCVEISPIAQRETAGAQPSTA